MMPETSCLSGEDEEDEQRNRRQHRAGEHDRVVDVLGRLQLAERDLEGRVLRHDEQRPEVVGPRRHEGEESEDRHRRSRGGNADVPERADHVRAVDAGGLDELVGDDVDQVLAHEEDAERRDQGRDDDRAERAGPAELLHHDEQRDDAELGRNGERRDHEDQEAFAPAEPQLREGVAGERREEDDRQR